MHGPHRRKGTVERITLPLNPVPPQVLYVVVERIAPVLPRFAVNLRVTYPRRYDAPVLRHGLVVASGPQSWVCLRRFQLHSRRE